MATYRLADPEVSELIKRLIGKHHRDLAEAGVRVGARLAFATVDENTGEPKGPALKHHGYPAGAIVRIVSHRDRVAGMPDAMIDLDGEAWENDWDDDRKAAVIDHELTHLEVQYDEDGAVKLDDCHRPKLKMRLHDWELGGFAEIAKRYKEAALEVEGARKMADKYGQMLFPW